MRRIDALLRGASARVDPADAALLLAHVLQRSRGWLYAHGDDAAPVAACAQFEALVARRIAGEPVAYLTGSRGFWSLELQVSPDTLIPRPETEHVIETVVPLAREVGRSRIVDVGTGSGCIAIALAHELPQAEIYNELAISGQARDLERGLADARAGLAVLGERPEPAYRKARAMLLSSLAVLLTQSGDYAGAEAPRMSGILH